MTRILVVEDEESYRDPLTYQLQREGYEVVASPNGTDALERFAEGGFDLVLLDLMLPGVSGTEVCRTIRLTSDVPVIMLTAKDDEIDKVVGLELGADDYVTKPYSSRELLARVRAVLRRRAVVPVPVGGGSALAADEDDDLLVAGPIRMDVERHTVRVHDELVSFPLKEFELLELLLRNAGRVLTRGQLIDRIWGSDYVGDTKTLDVHVKRVRAKVEPDPTNPTLLVTVRGLGYKLTPEG
ncbi:MAG: response regulator transcription factor [Brevundimonas sp.]